LRGGDIDLYIETNLETRENVRSHKSHLWIKLQERLGEQKIDIVIKSLKIDSEQRIFEVARSTGILLV
jgi:hypothetical protein